MRWLDEIAADRLSARLALALPAARNRKNRYVHHLRRVRLTRRDLES